MGSVMSHDVRFRWIQRQKTVRVPSISTEQSTASCRRECLVVHNNRGNVKRVGDEGYHLSKKPVVSAYSVIRRMVMVKVANHRHAAR